MPPEAERPEICHIKEEQWREIKKYCTANPHRNQYRKHHENAYRYPQDIRNIKKMSPYKMPSEKPTDTKMDNGRIRRKRHPGRNKKTKNNKAHGMDGIPGEAYKAIETWLTQPLRKIINKIHHGDTTARMA